MSTNYNAHHGSVVKAYEDFAWARPSPAPPILEFFSGTQVVRWWANIDLQIKERIAKFEAQKNLAYAGKLRAFSKVWKEHELTGSINREAVDALKAASSVLAEDPWSEGNYFANLTASLAILLASEEQLPRIPADQPGGGSGGGTFGGAGAGSAIPGGSFGPEDEKTPPGENQNNPEPEPESPDEEAESPDEGGQRPSIRRAVAAAVQQAQ